MKRPTLVLLTALVLVGCQGSEKRRLKSTYAVRLSAQESGCDASLRGLSAVSTEIAWASGSGGRFLRTVDGGETWTSSVVPGAEELDFRDVQGFSADIALLLGAGEPARVYRTEDGGASWTETYANETPGVFFDAMAFWNETDGMAFSDPIDGKLLVISTTDGGQTWKPIPPDRLPASRDGEAGFAASGTCLAVAGEKSVWIGTGGTVSRVFRSRDRGATWSVFETPLGQARASAGLFSLAFIDPQRGIAVGGDYLNPERSQQNIALTRDGGQTWDLVITDPPGGYRSAVAVVPETDPTVVVAVGRTGCDLSSDGGRSWRSFSEDGYYCLAVSPSGKVGWAAGAEGRIARLEIVAVRP